MKRDLPTAEICDLYLNKKMSSLKIAERYNCSKATILKILKKAKVRLRQPGVPRLKASDDFLKQLYLDKGLSTWKIAEILKCGRSTVHRKLKKWSVTRDIATAHIKYSRAPFSDNPIEKAYLIGFAIGDLRVRQVGKKSKTVKVDCGSTRKEQIDLIKKIFSKYGRVWISKRTKTGKTQIEAFLDESFKFLLDCRQNLEWEWINKKDFFIPFLAGFTDAEGSIFISNKRACYSLGNYDVELLKFIRDKLIRYKIKTSTLIKNKKKYSISGGYMQNQLYWHFVITRKKSLVKLLNMLSPYIQHQKRRNNIQKALDNISKRNMKKW
jgi:intein-encoded DNA endonuclease-like protein/transposase